VLIRRHNKIKYLRNHFRYLVQLNEDEISRLKGDITHFPEGNEWVDDNHPYTSDLDIFGRNSLFQFINGTVTTPGKALLATYLKAGVNQNELGERQEAVLELQDNIDWRQQFQASGKHFEDKKASIQPLRDWVSSPTEFSMMLLPVAIVMSSISIVCTTGWLMETLSVYWLLGSLAINGLIVGRKLQVVNGISEQLASSLGTIRATHDLLVNIQSLDVQSPFLTKLKHSIESNNYDAISEIKKLRFLLQFFDSRANGLYFLVNLVLMTDFYMLLMAEKWKSKNASSLDDWLRVVNEFEVTSSLAAVLFTHESFTMPAIASGHFIQMKAVGHPLIPASERIPNDFDLEGEGKVVVVTGSNMSGKSTFLRTLGVNMVLGLIGGPVCAVSAKFSYVHVFSGMRVKDNLEAHISSFYAELSRIRQLLDQLESNDSPVFYLLDEILKGTNSTDRHIGSEALIEQLSNTNSFGLVSTHDLSLGSMGEDSERVQNMHFSSTIDGNEILFDYKLKPGICDSFNASKLMEKMGILTPSPSKK
jgi:DNA mismatch repair ATPase MutS